MSKSVDEMAREFALKEAISPRSERLLEQGYLAGAKAKEKSWESWACAKEIEIRASDDRTWNELQEQLKAKEKEIEELREALKSLHTAIRNSCESGCVDYEMFGPLDTAMDAALARLEKRGQS